MKLNETAVVPPAGDNVIRSLFEITPLTAYPIIIMNAGNTVLINGMVQLGHSLGTVATANKRMHWAQFNDSAIGVDGTNIPLDTDGTTMGALGGSPPQGATAGSVTSQPGLDAQR